MFRLLVAGAFLAATGCVGEDNYDRPLELNYLTEQILAPSCGSAECHSAFAQRGTNVFDNPEGARASIVNNGLVRLDPLQYDPDMASRADLIQWITDTDPKGKGYGRMPFDAPLPNRDVKLLIEWIQHKAPGAQCNPDDFGGHACTFDASERKISVNCTADWDFDLSTAIPCPADCVDGVCQ